MHRINILLNEFIPLTYALFKDSQQSRYYWNLYAINRRPTLTSS